MVNRQTLEWLRAEVQLWQKEGLLSPAQAQGILARPGYGETLAEPPSRRLTKLLAILGGLLVGAGLILFISSNWRVIPNAAKLILVLETIIGAYFAGYRLRFGPSPRPGLAAGFFFLGAIAYGSGIFLVAQIYNFHADWRTGILYWFLGTLPLAYAVDSRPVLWLSLSTLILWCATRFEDTGGVFLVLWQGLGGLLMAASYVHLRHLQHRRFAKIYFGLGSGLVLFTTLMMTFDGIATSLAVGRATGEFVALCTALLVLCSVAFVSLSVGPWSAREPAYRRLYAVLLLALAPGILLLTGHNPGNPYLIGANLLMFAECSGLILFGVAVRTRAYLHLGICFFLALVACRYFDNFWEYLPRSLFFVFGGVLMLLLGWFLEIKRRRWVAEFEGEEMQ